MSEHAVIDIDDLATLRRVAEEVRDSRSAVRLRIDGMDVAVMLPAPTATEVTGEF